MEQDIIERLMDFERCGLTALERVNLRECAAIEIHKLRCEIERCDAACFARDKEMADLRREMDRYKDALKVIAGSADWLVSRQAAAALDNIGPPVS